MQPPPADLDIAVADVDRLLATQHPALRGPLTRVAHGWDNDVFRLGDDLAVRLPRRELAAHLIENEQRWLPELAPRLAVPIPVPVALGVPDEHFPWHWSVVPWFPGRRGLDLAPHERDAVAVELAGVLRALHVPAPTTAPVNPFRGVPMRQRDDVIRERLAIAPELLPVWEAGLAASEWRGPDVWLHGDMHAGNVIFDGDRIGALIDFGDMCSGDPASDLSVAWLAFTATGRTAFRAALADLYDESDWTRARGWAAALALISVDSDDPGFRAVARHARTQLTA
ncbi:aminoglycoside phosphotransferase family protein [Microbacterium invictum]|uniref:Aminoglycoside phosphotransferase (APT) family kinase protein n=1 Tax=Microbacterium invictum TaxID=515415 RepID=A0AA40VLN2_9MICO|nr:aminoglycoside phosphotransferase family protein [Microbacterium invictum]MBB4139544.1 aminoglycoside phosphotransferase (APT) family kinase protein [Microbacterium invictum]